MPKIIVVTGDSETGKSELLTKLYETILRWYDNYELTIEKQPINSLGDFLVDIVIKRNMSLKNDNEERYPNEISCNGNKDNCCNNEPKQNDKKESIRILINTAGDELENFALLERKICIDYDFLVMALRKDESDRGKSLNNIYSSLESHPGTGNKKNLPNVDIQSLFSSSTEFFNTHHNDREKNLMCIMTEIVCYIYSNLK